MHFFGATVCKTVCPILSYPIQTSVCLSVCPVCLSVTLVYCGQTVGWIEMKLVMQVDLSPGHIVLDGDPAPPSPKRHSSQIFGPCLLWSNGWMDKEFKMPLGMEVGFGPGHIVLDVDRAPPPPKGHSPPIFGPCLLWPNGHPSQLLLSTCSRSQCCLVVTFCVSRRQREMYCGHAHLCVCLSAAACLHYCTDPDVTWGSGRGCPIVVHYWADLQSVHRLRCYGNTMEMHSRAQR